MLVIGNPENRRIAFFQEALHSLGQKPARVISWLEILQQQVDLYHELGRATVIRIESPGENFSVEKKILEWGGLESAKDLIDERGRIYYPGIWYQGFKKVLKQINSSAQDSLWFNHPDDILTMFDKPKVKQLNPAFCLATCPGFACYESFLEYVKSQPYPRFFIKLNYGSSASGVMAFQYNSKSGQAQGQTTIELVRKKNQNCFYNSLRLKKYSEHRDLQEIINFLLDQGAFIEPWIPKARHEDGVFDLRVLAINGQRQHTIARISKTPITNLHLGNQRRPGDELDFSQEKWQEIDLLVSEVMKNFSGSLYSGLDILLPQYENRAPALLEANAFGDLLPGLSQGGYNTYQAELIALFNKYPQLMSKAA